MKLCLFQHSDGSMSATITAIRLSPLHLRGCVGAVKLKSELENGGLTMTKYIDREALLLRIDCHGTNKFGMLDEDIRAFVKAQSAADVAPVVHGRWIGAPLCGNDNCKCSECGNWCNIHVNLCGEAIQKYCPYCGAKMDLEG